MHVVVIHGWREETAELAQTLATALGIMVFEARQRLIGGGPAVVASFADQHQALSLAEKLSRSAVAALVVDASEVRKRTGQFIVRRFVLGERSLSIEAGDDQRAEIAYDEVDLLLPATSIIGQVETKTVTERKFSLGKTIIAGGIPLTKKVEHQEEITAEERTRVLYLYAGNRPSALFSQIGMTYDGLGAAMKMSREQNFSHLTSELRRLAPGAGYDDRLLSRIGQARLLGPALPPETNLDLAAEILARTLRRRAPS